jgi:hypothetical protein
MQSHPFCPDVPLASVVPPSLRSMPAQDRLVFLAAGVRLALEELAEFAAVVGADDEGAAAALAAAVEVVGSVLHFLAGDVEEAQGHLTPTLVEAVMRELDPDEPACREVRNILDRWGPSALRVA